MSVPDNDPLIGQVLLDQFKVLRRLGQGGMGAVYLAEQTSMARPVAVKVLHAQHADQQQALARFQREARAVARLSHPHIVSVHVFGALTEGTAYLVMEYVRGRELAAHMAHGPMSERRALRIVAQVLDALIEAHRNGVVHRDLKPENIMLEDRDEPVDHVKVLDFGLARVVTEAQGDGRLTAAGALFGTPRYMSPEQARGREADARSDLYTVGLILWELVAGEPAIRATTPLEYLFKQASERTPSVSSRRADVQVSAQVEALLERALEKDPERRFASAREMLDAVNAAIAAAAKPPTLTRPKTPAWAFHLGLSLTLFVCGATAVWRWEVGRQRALIGDTVETTPNALDAVAASAPEAALGAPFAGVPLPEGATPSMTSPQLVGFRVTGSPRPAIEALRRAFGDRCDFVDVPNGLYTQTAGCPVSAISIAAEAGGRHQVMVLRNALATNAPQPPARVPPTATRGPLGEPLMSGLRLMTGDARTRVYVGEVDHDALLDFYGDIYAGAADVTWTRVGEMTSVLNEAPDAGFRMLSVSRDAANHRSLVSVSAP